MLWYLVTLVIRHGDFRAFLHLRSTSPGIRRLFPEAHVVIVTAVPNSKWDVPLAACLMCTDSVTAYVGNDFRSEQHIHVHFNGRNRDYVRVHMFFKSSQWGLCFSSADVVVQKDGHISRRACIESSWPGLSLEEARLHVTGAPNIAFGNMLGITRQYVIDTFPPTWRVKKCSTFPIN